MRTCDGSLMTIETLEPRRLLTANLDVIGVTQLRADSRFADFDGTGFAVAVIDTGVDPSHPLLSNNWVEGYDFVFNETGNRLVSDHGTHVAGIVAGRPDPSRGYDGGVAPDAGIVGLQVFTPDANGAGSPGAVTTDINEALNWVQDNHRRLNITAVNMSLGAGAYTSAAQAGGDARASIIASLEREGVTVVSAAGNNYGGNFDSIGNAILPLSNAAAPGVLSTIDVGATYETNEGQQAFGNVADFTTESDRVASFTQRPADEGNVLFAPGALILSTVPGNGLVEFGGTSMAAPTVAGAVAVVQEAAQSLLGRTLVPGDVRQLLLDSADTIFDGDDEDDGLAVDTNADGVADAAIDLPNTNRSFKRLNVYNAVLSIWNASQSSGTPTPTPGTDVGDTNGALDRAVTGFVLDGSDTPSVTASIGLDGTRDAGATDVDLYRFEVQSQGTVTLSTTAAGSGSADTVLRLFDSGGRQLAVDDDSGGNGFSRIAANVSPGVYFAGVSGTGNATYNPSDGTARSDGSTGNYTLIMGLSNIDPNGLISGAVDVTLGGYNFDPQVRNGLIGADYGAPVGVSDVDLFRVFVPDDGTLVIDIDSPFETDFVDSFVRVFDSDGNVIAVADDVQAPNEVSRATGKVYEGATFVGHTTDAYLTASVRRGGTYYIGVSDYFNDRYDPETLDNRSAGGSGGFYDIEIDFFNRDVNGAIPTAAPIGLPLTQTAVIGVDGSVDVGDRDVDFFALTPANGQLVEAVLQSRSLGGNGQPFDAVLRLFTSTGELLGVSEALPGTDPVLRYVGTGETVYLSVSGRGNDTFDPFLLGSGNPGESGIYQIAVRQAAGSVSTYADDLRTWAGVSDLEINQQVAGIIGTDNSLVRGDADVDLYRFTPDFTGPVIVRASQPPDFNVNTVLRVFDSTGTEIAFNDDLDATRIESQVRLNVTEGVTYVIGVSGASAGPRAYDINTGGAVAGDTGPYLLSVSGGWIRLADGRAYVDGTDAAEDITLFERDGRYRVVRGGELMLLDPGDVPYFFIDAKGGDDTVTLGQGLPNSYAIGSAGDDTMYSQGGSDTLVGGAGRNYLYGGDGDDRLAGSNGRDFLFGEGGDDRLYGEGGNDDLYGGGNVDRLYGGAGDDKLFGGNSKDKIYAGEGDDLIVGGKDDDLLQGEAGDDSIEGNDGDDFIVGGIGMDTLVGGIGRDEFIANDGILDRIERDADDVLNSDAFDVIA